VLLLLLLQTISKSIEDATISAAALIEENGPLFSIISEWLRLFRGVDADADADADADDVLVISIVVVVVVVVVG
jgi:hypothetical protein